MPSKRARQAFEQGVKSSEDGDLLSAERHFRDALTYDLNWSKAREHLVSAADDTYAPVGGYMHTVARVHVDQLNGQ